MIIAIDSSNEDLAGAIVYWRLTGDVNGDDLNNALTDAGLAPEHRLPLPTPRRALRRTLKECAKGSVFMRAGKGKDGGLYLVEQITTDEGPRFDVILDARLTIGGTPKFSNEDMSEMLTERFWHHVFHVASTDISSWLIDQARECDALSLRDTGGVYFVPRHAIDEWRKRADALHSASDCTVHLVPAMNSEEALDAVLEALIEECVQFSEQLDADLTDGELGSRALRSRADQAMSYLDKVARFEKLLGAAAEGKLDELRKQIEDQKANAVSAALTIESEGE